MASEVIRIKRKGSGEGMKRSTKGDGARRQMQSSRRRQGHEVSEGSLGEKSVMSMPKEAAEYDTSVLYDIAGSAKKDWKRRDDGSDRLSPEATKGDTFTGKNYYLSKKKCSRAVDISSDVSINDLWQKERQKVHKRFDSCHNTHASSCWSQSLLSKKWIFSVFMITCVVPINIVTAQQRFRRVPDNQTAAIGDTVTLACSVINKAGLLQWMRDGFGLGIDRNLAGYDRYHMIGSEEEGDYTLVIDPVSLKDDAVFQCQVGPSQNGGDGLMSANAKLTVEVPTETPRIVQGDKLLTTEDREIELECFSRGGKPAAEITWIDGTGREVTEGVKTIKELLEDGKRFNVRSILSFRPKKEHHNKTFTCQAHNRPSKQVKSAFIQLEVKYAPKVKVKIQSTRLSEGQNARITCRAEANPPEIVYRWFINDKVIAGDHGTVLNLYNVSRKYHDAIVKCEVQNSVGKSEDSETLEISYGPVFRRKPYNIEADLGQTVTLTCDVDGYPPPEIVWFYTPTRTAVSTSSNYTTTVTKDTEGRYICQAVVQGFSQISSEAFILLKGPPKIESHSVQYGLEGTTVKLECLVASIPKPDKISWSNNGREIDINDHEYSILEDPLPNGVKSTLVIREASEKDFGPYNCTVTNPYDTKYKQIFLMKKKSGQLVIILTCVLGAVVIIVAITMICLLCQKKGKKPPMMEGDGVEKVTKQSDRSSNDSDLKVEIRTASSLSNMPEHDSEHWDEGSDAVKNESLYRYSDYFDPVFPPKSDSHNNNGYVPYSNYVRDYNPPIPRNSLYAGGSGGSGVGHHHHHHHQYHMNNIDPRYSASAYGNLYLRTSNNSLPPPHSLGGGSSSGAGSGNDSPTGSSHPLTSPPTSYQLNNRLSGASSNHHLMNNMVMSSANNILSNHISKPVSISPTGSGTSNHLSSSHNNHIHTPSNPSLVPPNVNQHSNSSSPANNVSSNYSMRNGSVPRSTSSASSQYIVPSQPQLKPGTLATHV